MYSYVYPPLLFLFLYGQLITPEQIPFDTIISFGDSSIDTGNVYNLTNHTWPLVPPYFQGRFSDGFVWIERLGLSNIRNYAYGGATSDNNLVQGYSAMDTTPVPGVRQQISIYLNETRTTARNFARTLYVIQIAGNDYYFNRTILPSVVADSIINSVRDLLQIGVKHLLVVNQSPIQAMPFVQMKEQMIYYRTRTMQHNQNLSMKIEQLDYNRKEVSLYLFDLYSFILKIIHTPSLNTKDSCWNISNGQVISRCSTPESYIYIDQYHFTARTHELISNAVRQDIVRSSRSNKPTLIAFIFCALLLVFLFVYSCRRDQSVKRLVQLFERRIQSNT